MSRSVTICYFVFVMTVVVMVVACSSTPTYSIEGDFLGEHVNTTVDSSIAQYYFTSYLRGKNTNPDLHKRIEKHYVQQKGHIPSREELQIITKENSVDYAALFFADHLLRQNQNQWVQNRFVYYLNNDTLKLSPLNDAHNEYIVLFVPGWDYVEYGHLTGADFAEPRRLITKLDIENYLVAIPPLGAVEENAKVLSEEIIKHSQSKKGIIVVGASSAGPAIHLSLENQLSDEQRLPIKAWVNLGGILRGSPVIDHYQEWPQSWFFSAMIWFKGWDKEKILSMSYQRGLQRFSQFKKNIGEQVLIINYVGLSLSGVLSDFSEDVYPILSSKGPNDGLTLLPDIIAPNSYTIIAPNSDHYFAEDPRINEKTIALMKVVISLLEKNPDRLAHRQNIK